MSIDQQNRNQYNHRNDEISLYDLLKSIKHWFLFVLRRWLYFLCFIALGIGAAMLWRSTKEPVYHGELTLMLNDDGGNSFSGLSGVLGQFGIAVSSGRYNIDKLIEIARSKKIIDLTLSRKATIDQENDYLANHLIYTFDLQSKWKEEFPLESILFDQSFQSPYDDLILKRLYKLIVGEDGSGGALSTDYGRDHYIMTFAFDSPEEDLSISFLQNHFETLREYYIQNSIEKQQQTYDIIKSKHDSLQIAIGIVDNKLARLKDQSLGAFSNQSSIEIAKLNTESLILKTAYTKAVENLAIAELALQNKTPLIQSIDLPTSPIEPSRPSLLKTLLFGTIAGIGACLFYFFIHFLRSL